MEHKEEFERGISLFHSEKADDEEQLAKAT